MRKIAVEKSDLDTCVTGAQSEQIVVTRGGSPVALIVGIEGLDEEQARLGASDKFWKLIRERRKEKTLSRSALEAKLKGRAPRNRRA